MPWAHEFTLLNRVPERVPEKVWEALAQSQVRFNRVPEKVPEKVWEALAQSQVRLVQQGSGEGSGEGLGGFGAEPGQVQQGSGEGSGHLGGQVQQDLRLFDSRKPS